jgi:hypothetical protein
MDLLAASTAMLLVLFHMSSMALSLSLCFLL